MAEKTIYLMAFKCKDRQFHIKRIGKSLKGREPLRIHCTATNRACSLGCPSFSRYHGEVGCLGLFAVGEEVMYLSCKRGQFIYSITGGGEFVRKKIKILCKATGRNCDHSCKFLGINLSYGIK